jgi:hypothetical protein
MDTLTECPLGCYTAGDSTFVGRACLFCPAGNYSNQYNAKSCPACNAGTYNSGGRPSSSCALCEAGSYSFSGQAQCTLCSAGTFNPSEGRNTSSACTLCPPGSCSPSAGSQSCLRCSAGRYSGSGQSECALCAAGSFSDSPGSDTCKLCLSGSYCPTSGSSTTVPCKEGFYCPPGSSAPTVCPAGSYCGNNAGSPTPCPQNTYSASPQQSSQSQCAACPPGEQSGPGSFQCSAPCVPSPFNFQTFGCYSTQSKVLVVFSWCVSFFSAVFFPFKMRAIYKKRKAKLEAKGLLPTLKNIIFYRSVVAASVQQQPLI